MSTLLDAGLIASNTAAELSQGKSRAFFLSSLPKY